MKKALSIILLFVIVFSIVGCGGERTDNDLASTEISSELEVSNSSKETTSENSDVEWKKFLKDYEKWVDEYISITKKYKDNPSDMTILSDYTSMMTELTEWYSKVDDMQKELENASSSELVEYSKELARIAAKLAEASY